MTPVFLDTVGLIAVWDTCDQWNASAEVVYRLLVAQGCPLVTTSFILLECGNAAARRPYRAYVGQLRQLLLEEGLLIEPTPDDVERAWAAYDRGESGQAGIVDQVSFVVMRRLGLTEAFTNDRHFQAAGFTALF